MNLLWPVSLLLLALIPPLVGLYVWALRRRRPYAVRYSSLALVREALAGQPRWPRHVPFALFLLALGSLIIALARPAAVVQVPTNQTAIILAMDVSRSMCATDIAPSRLAAAQDAALAFIERQPAGTRIGVVAFAGFAQLIQAPTTDRRALATAVRGLTTARGTAIGSGILESLDAIAAVNPRVAPSVRDDPPTAAAPPASRGFAAEIIVLLTDGVTTTGIDPEAAAQQAAERGVRVYTIGFGTANGGAMSCGGGGGFGGGGFGGGGFGGGFRRGIDEAALEQIAEITDGAYYAASSAGELQSVFERLPLTFTLQSEQTEISAGFAAVGLLLAAAAVGLALRRGALR
jgi:Ca-activated chloride channel family protein